MNVLRSERLSAILLLVAAVIGLVVANLPFGESVLDFFDIHGGVPALGLDLSIRHWVTDGLLAVFFFLAAIELRHELTHGELDSPKKALIPAIAAVGGVIAPALVFLALVREGDEVQGWPIPTATDIAFALGVLALVGRGLSPKVRALLLALAVIDDLIAILIIAFFFTTDLSPVPLILAVPVILLFGWLSYRRHVKKTMPRWLFVAILVALGVVAWVLVYLSGVHATIAGVALGLIMAPGTAQKAYHAIQPFSNGFVLPVFAFVASLVLIPDVGFSGLSMVFWAILIALPVGKLVGVLGGALIASRLVPKGERRTALPPGDVLTVALLAGIGFTVSLLMNELAYRDQEEIASEGTLAVLSASLIAMIAGGTVTAIRAKRARERAAVDA